MDNTDENTTTVTPAIDGAVKRLNALMDALGY